MTDERFNEIVELIESELEFDVEVANFYHDPGRTNCANDDAYPPETSYELVSEPYEIDIDITPEELDEVLEDAEEFYFTVNGKDVDGKVYFEWKDGKLLVDIDPEDFEEEIMDDFYDGLGY